MTDNNLPTYKCRLIKNRKQLVLKCPLCKKNHYHGSADQQAGVENASHRVAHCGPHFLAEGSIHHRGYLIFFDV